MAKTSLLRSVWSERFLYNLDENLVFGNITNTDYEGDASNATIVKINAMGAISVNDYDGGTGSVNFQDISTTSQDLSIDQKKYFAFNIDDVDIAQTNLALVDKAMERAAYAMGQTVDNKIASLYTAVDSGSAGLGTDAAPIVATGSLAYDTLVTVAKTLDDQNVSNFNRFAVIPPWYKAELMKDSRLLNLSWDIIENGLAVEQPIAGLKVYVSNNVSNTASAKYKILAGTADAIAFVGQISAMEKLRPDDSFSDAVKGLYVYGAKVIEADGLTLLTADPS